MPQEEEEVQDTPPLEVGFIGRTHTRGLRSLSRFHKRDEERNNNSCPKGRNQHAGSVRQMWHRDLSKFMEILCYMWNHAAPPCCSREESHESS